MKIKRILSLFLSLLLFASMFGFTDVSYADSYKFEGSVNSDVYHYLDCYYTDRILDKNKIWFTSVTDAVNHGYRPCKGCKPPGTESAPQASPTVTTQPATNQTSICVTINSVSVPMDEAEPFVENGRTYVPVRAVLEAYKVDSIGWEAPFVIVKKGNVTLRIPVGEYYIEKNGTQIPIDSPALIRESRTCLPIRAVIEALGGSVGWDAGSRTVVITKPVT